MVRCALIFLLLLAPSSAVALSLDGGALDESSSDRSSTDAPGSADAPGTAPPAVEPKVVSQKVPAVAPVKSAVDFQGRARLWTGTAVDSNARRDFVSEEIRTQPDLFFYALGQLEGVLRLGERVRLSGSYDVSGRKFILAPTEDTVVQAAQLEATVALGRFFAFGVGGRARDRRGAERDYTDLVGGALLDFLPDPAIDVRAQISAHRFLFYNRFEYSFWGPDGLISARYRINRRHSVSAFGSYNPRTYNGKARPRPGPEGDRDGDDVADTADNCPDNANRDQADDDQDGIGNACEVPVVRTDSVFGAGISYSYRGPFQFSFSYSYMDQSSISFGESVQRHRLNATLGARLPWSLMLLTSLTWQPAVFPEGVYLSQELTVLEEDENVSSLTVKLVKPLGRYFDLDLRYAGFLGYLPQNDFLYMRHVISFGVAVNY